MSSWYSQTAFSLTPIVRSETCGGQAATSLKMSTGITAAAVTVRLCVSPLPTTQGKEGTIY